MVDIKPHGAGYIKQVNGNLFTISITLNGRGRAHFTIFGFFALRIKSCVLKSLRYEKLCTYYFGDFMCVVSAYRGR